MTPENSSPGGKGIPSTTVMDNNACWGDNRVIVPSTTEAGAGGCGLVCSIDMTYVHGVQGCPDALPVS